MQRASELVGKTVVTADSGEKVGRAADLLVNDGGDHVIGIVIGGGVLASERVLPFEDVQTLGRDAIVARSQQRVVDAREWHGRHIKASRSSGLKDRRVVTRDGREIGTITDVYVDELTGEVQAYDVADRTFAGLISRRRLLHRSGEVTVGPDAVLISPEAAARLEAAEEDALGGVNRPSGPAEP